MRRASFDCREIGAQKISTLNQIKKKSYTHDYFYARRQQRHGRALKTNCRHPLKRTTAGAYSFASLRGFTLKEVRNKRNHREQ
jgi:hypothetical protein